MRKDALNLTAHESLLMVVRPIRARELDMVRFLFQDSVADAVRSQPDLIGLGVVGFVGIDDLGVSGGKLWQHRPIILAGRADDGGADQLMFAIAADVGFVAVEALVVFAGVAGIGIGGTAFARGLGVRTFTAGFDQGWRPPASRV